MASTRFGGLADVVAGGGATTAVGGRPACGLGCDGGGAGGAIGTGAGATGGGATGGGAGWKTGADCSGTGSVCGGTFGVPRSGWPLPPLPPPDAAARTPDPAGCRGETWAP